MSEEEKSMNLKDQVLEKTAGGTGGGSNWEPYIDQSTCTVCYKCKLLCPNQAIVRADVGFALKINPHQCSRCKHCLPACDTGSLHIPPYD